MVNRYSAIPITREQSLLERPFRPETQLGGRTETGSLLVVRQSVATKSEANGGARKQASNRHTVLLK